MKEEFQKRLLSSLILIPLSFFFIIKGSFLFNFFIIIVFFITLYEWYMMSKKESYHFFGYPFLIFSFYTVYSLRNDFGDQSENLVFFLFILLICISTDIGGYIFGKIFKGPKLTKISPNKTISGALGSIMFSATFASLAIYYFTKNFEPYIIIVGFVTSISCQIGDLFFSFLKRKSLLKDTGNFLPGHGGILDRVDGVLLGLPIGFLTLLIIY